MRGLQTLNHFTALHLQPRSGRSNPKKRPFTVWSWCKSCPKPRVSTGRANQNQTGLSEKNPTIMRPNAITTPTMMALDTKLGLATVAAFL
jgi:hypothetical protein